jgi:hypothetical protein
MATDRQSVYNLGVCLLDQEARSRLLGPIYFLLQTLAYGNEYKRTHKVDERQTVFEINPILMCMSHPCFCLISQLPESNGASQSQPPQKGRVNSHPKLKSPIN